MAQLSRKQREAVESAGYRVMRWVAARNVLQSRVMKGRIGGPVGEFLGHWLSLAPGSEIDAELWLSFDYEQEQGKLTLADGSAPLAKSPVEQALLHLPALRMFWSQELRQQHFEALQSLVPQAWLLDAAEIPPGAVIHGLGSVSWDYTQLRGGREWQIQGREGLIRDDWQHALAGRDSVLTVRESAKIKLNAKYGRNDKDQLVLRSLEAAP